MQAEAGHVLALAADADERAIYVLGDAIEVDGTALASFTLGVLTSEAAQISAPTGSHYVIIGGEPLGHRHMVWNFVSSSKDKIEAAKAAWRAGTMGHVPGETEFIPLP